MDDTAGYVEIMYCTYLGDPDGVDITDPTPIAWVDFVVDDLGTSVLDLYNSEFSDPNGTPIPHEEVDGFFRNIPE
jgi:hypothetical protein